VPTSHVVCSAQHVSSSSSSQHRCAPRFMRNMEHHHHENVSSRARECVLSFASTIKQRQGRRTVEARWGGEQLSRRATTRSHGKCAPDFEPQQIPGQSSEYAAPPSPLRPVGACYAGGGGVHEPAVARIEWCLAGAAQLVTNSRHIRRDEFSVVVSSCCAASDGGVGCSSAVACEHIASSRHGGRQSNVAYARYSADALPMACSHGPLRLTRRRHALPHVAPYY